MIFIYGILILLLLQMDIVQSARKPTNKQLLYEYLLTNYSSHLLPECDEKGPVVLVVDVALRQIVELNEPEQVIEANIWMRLKWTDCRLVWDPADFNNITSVAVFYEDVWQPDITLYDSAATADNVFPGREKYRTHISRTGEVSYNFPTISSSICGIDVTYFPFDTQICSLNFGSWSYNGLELDIYSRNEAGDTDTYIPNNEWILQDLPAKRNVKKYNCCPQPYPDITYLLTIKRRPTFYVITMLFPCILVVFVAGLTFILPTESGEKVSLEITVLLSLSVFLLVVSEALPPSADKFPLIGVYFATSMVLVTLSLVQTVFVVNVYNRGANGRKVPRWVRILFINYLGRLLCMNRRDKNRADLNSVIQNSARDTQVPVHKGNQLLFSARTSKTETMPVSEDGVQVNITEKRTNGTEMINQMAVHDESTQTGLDYTDKVGSNQLAKRKVKHLETLKSANDSKEAGLVSDEWRDISNVLDRLFLLIYTVVSLVVTIVIIYMLVHHQ